MLRGQRSRRRLARVNQASSRGEIMTGVWALATLWLGLALVASLLSPKADPKKLATEPGTPLRQVK
jgi:hypothetical protein